MQLNPEQIQAINFREGYVDILATAGAGKTTVIKERVQALFREGAAQDDVLVLTFTVEAAHNLEKRLNLKLSKALRGGFRTFHSFCLNLVHNEARFLSYGLSANPFPEGNTLSKMILQAMKQNGIRRKEYDAVQAYISRNKRQRISPEQAAMNPEDDHAYARAYSTYESNMRAGGMLDFDSMIIEAVNILEDHPEVRDRWQFKWPMADEAQDTDDLQFRLLQLISERHKNMFVVGDFCQALYAFRGAHPDNLLNFQQWFPGAKQIILPENYRSTPEIVKYSREKAPVRNDLTNNIRTSRPASNIPIEFRMYATPVMEADAILATAATDPGNSAILARTNEQLGIYETLALQHGIKFHLLGKSGLWNKSEIKSLVGLAGFCMSSKSPERYPETLIAGSRMRIRNMPPFEALKAITQQSNLESLYSSEDYTENENFAILNIRTVTEIAKRFRTLQDFLNHARKAAHASRKSKNAITLSTVHQAKGLEWNNVFVIGVQEGKMPHEKGELDEEARIFYVAITRAARRLRLSFAGTPSSFLEADLTPEIRAELQKSVGVVEKLKQQQELFS